MPNSFAESSQGVVLIANGVDPMLRWDGYAEQAEPAGVAAPDPAVIPVVAPAGDGSMTGTYFVFVRFVDRNGNFSNLSSPSAGVTVTNAGGFAYSSLPVPQEASVVRRQVLRNTAGQASVFYVDLDTDDTTSSALESTTLDPALASGEAIPLTDQDGLPFASRYLPPPDTKPFLAYHLNMMWGAGEQPYAEGSLAVTRFSATVTGVGTQWPQTFAGRFLYVRGATRAYEIASVEPSTQTITLTENYGDSTDPFAQYAIKPSPGEAASLRFSEPGLPESWPPWNAFTLPEDGDDVTGLCNYSSFLWIFKRRRTYRMTAQQDPRKDGFIFYALGRGCVNNRCWVVVEENLYLMDEGGVFRTGGGDTAEQLSTPIQDLFRKDEAGSINWSASRYFHCSYSPSEETIRWFITMRGTYLPRHAICLHHKTGKWWMEKYPRPIGGSVLGRSGRSTGGWGEGGGEQLFLGSTAGEILAPGGALDGTAAAGVTTRGMATAAGIDTLTDTRATFDTAWKNLPVMIVSGRGAGQSRLVVSATGTVLRVDEAWAVQPDATSTYQVGGIAYKYTGGRMRYAPGEQQHGASVEIQFAPVQEPQVTNLRILQDFSVLPRVMGRGVDSGQRPGVTATKGGTEYRIDLQETGGTYWQRFDHKRETSVNAPRLVRVQLEGVSGVEPIRFGEMVLNGLVK